MENYIVLLKKNIQKNNVLFYQVFSGLCYLYENNIIHKDINLETKILILLDYINLQKKKWLIILLMIFLFY